MTISIKDQRKALKTIITNAISVALTKNTHLNDKKVQKAIKNAATEVAKRITNASIVKVPKVVKPKVAKPKAVKAKTTAAPAKKVVKKVIKKTVAPRKKPVAKKV